MPIYADEEEAHWFCATGNAVVNRLLYLRQIRSREIRSEWNQMDSFGIGGIILDR